MSDRVPWRDEPFRVFFPLGVVLGWVGVGHWLLYAVGASATYSCLLHALVQMQGFMMAFALGFLLTAVPRRTRSAGPSAVELAIAVAALVLTTGAALAGRWGLAEGAYGVVFLLLGRFALVRLRGRGAGRRPPAAFVLLPIAVLQGVAGAGLVAAWAAAGAAPWTLGLGRLLLEQGVFLCLAIGVGSLVLPLIAGLPPPADLGTSPAETGKAIAYAGAGVALFATLVLEHRGWVRAAPLARAAVVTLGLVLGGGAGRRPLQPGLHRRLVWLAVWCMPIGLATAGLWPDYRVPALHVLFIGGFSLLAFGVATHVALGHLGLEHLARGRPRAVAVLGAAFVVAMMTRVAADMSHTYFAHLGWAAAAWLAGSAAWLVFLGPRLLGR